ncbi:TOBE domain-containing protein, partial [Agrobacterium pusense]|uniref:TOBE domain-containing protein n=1 Tax=Agrobacterium pusense TaxID=648995 RepID=UPI002351DC54
MGVRPERLQTQDADPSLMTFDAKVRLVEHLGRETIVHADASPLMAVGSDTGTHNVTIQLGKVVPFDVGSSIRVGFALDDCYLFGPDGKTLT